MKGVSKLIMIVASIDKELSLVTIQIKVLETCLEAP